MTIKLVISGCCGKMGQTIARCALQDSVFSIGAALEAMGHAAIRNDYGTLLGHAMRPAIPVQDDARSAIGQGDVVIEFTSPEATIAHAQIAQDLRKPMVIGTTGLSESQFSRLREASRAIPLVVSPNMSLAVNVLFELAPLAAQRLGTAYDIEIVESHHRQKKDAPSGTAKRLAERLAETRRQPSGTIPVHAVRAGDIVGDHTVILAGPAERLELTHRAHSREVFAQGALRAARFIVRQNPGVYDMSHVLKETG